MTKENKELVAIDVCGRIHSNVVFKVGEYNYTVCGYMSTDTQPIKAYFFKDTDGDRENPIYIQFPLKSYKPYLRPLGSMTEGERRTYKELSSNFGFTEFYKASAILIGWLNQKMLDYRHLIPNGLAIEAPNGMYDN